jgi:hypothetical protein
LAAEKKAEEERQATLDMLLASYRAKQLLRPAADGPRITLQRP